MSDIPPQRVAIIVVQFRHVLKIRRALRYQRALAKKRHFGRWVKTVLSRELVDIGHELISRNPDKRIPDFAGDVLGHRDDTLLAPVLVVGIALGMSARVEAIIFVLRLFRGLSDVVADALLEHALLLVERSASEYFTPLVAMVQRVTDALARASAQVFSSSTRDGACQNKKDPCPHSDEVGMVFS